MIAAAVSLFYTGGMFLNDAFDREVDARLRADRPIPAGEVAPGTAFAIGFGLLAAGELVLAAGHGGAAALVWGALLAAAIVYYDVRHKRDPFGPAVMGICRGLVYGVAAAAVSGAVAPRVLIAGGVLALYVIGLTVIAKRIGPRASVAVPVLIAGISFVDAGVIVVCGSPALALVAASGCVATLVLQRVVAGT